MPVHVHKQYTMSCSYKQARAYVWIDGGGASTFLPALPFHNHFPLFSYSLSLQSLLYPFPSLSASPPLRSRALINQLECLIVSRPNTAVNGTSSCKLSQRGPGWSSAQKRIWCTPELWNSVSAIQPVVKPVEQPAWQPVVSCKRGLRKSLVAIILSTLECICTVDRSKFSTN